jgi:hypothetical protein
MDTLCLICIEHPTIAHHKDPTIQSTHWSTSQSTYHPISTESPIWARKKQLTKLQTRAHDAILQSQMMMIKDTMFRAYQIGDLVWLDACNLKTTHPTHKLRGKWYRPFKVTNACSHVAYQLQLPNLWKIHNVFHASYLSMSLPGVEANTRQLSRVV